VGESDLWITVSASAPEFIEELALQKVTELRGQIQTWMLLDTEFATSLVPLPDPGNAPEIIRRMYSSSRVMGVGPMACVAGAIAGLTAETLLPLSPDCIVENGGDSMLYSTRERVVAMLSKKGGKARVGVRLLADDFPVSLCASSAFIGHSLSLGHGELAVVRSADPFLADAAATAFCNLLHEPEDTARAAEIASGYAGYGIDGVFLQCQGSIAVWGKMELIAL
jgi:Uncharacterized conserved protein